jgi:sterol desaturase/sphingolipid hydroxylase (fatty acid hydroxylase superfamily)
MGLGTSQWVTQHGLGAVLLLPLPGWGRFAAGFVLMDLTFYYWHRANHRIRVLWRFHNVHHVDPDLDISTSFRFHFGEIAYSSVFRIFQVLLIGINPLTYVVYEAVFSAETMFHHTNIRLPVDLERWLNKLIVTPRMHGIHHSVVGSETNSNYSVIFPWWDRLNRTLMLNVPQASIKVGVPGYQAEKDNRLWSLITMPFVRQKHYWRFADGKAPRNNRDRAVKATRMLQ